MPRSNPSPHTTGVLDSAYDIDIDAGTVDVHVAPALGPVYSHELVYLRPGFAVAFGGRGVGEVPRADTFSYEPASGDWTDLRTRRLTIATLQLRHDCRWRKQVDRVRR